MLVKHAAAGTEQILRGRLITERIPGLMDSGLSGFCFSSKLYELYIFSA